MSAAPKLLFHVQHLLGIGHLMRAAAIARACAADGIEVHVASGGIDPGHVDWGAARLHRLPVCRASGAGFEGLVDAEGRPLDDAWMERRRDTTLALAARIDPDILLVEGFPFARRKFQVELLALMAWMGDRRRPVASSVRDILVRPPKPIRRRQALAWARDHVDRILCHGDPDFEPLEASFPDLAALRERIVYTGYVAPHPPLARAPEPRAEVIVSCGGGAIGGDLARVVLKAKALSRADTMPWIFRMGPNLPIEDRPDPAALPPGIVLEPAAPDFLERLTAARLSVSQAGYNTVMDLMRARVRAVLCPFGAGDETEQPRRAELLAARGLAHVVPSGTLTPESLAAAADAALDGPPPGPVPFALDGDTRMPGLLREMLA